MVILDIVLQISSCDFSHCSFNIFFPLNSFYFCGKCFWRCIFFKSNFKFRRSFSSSNLPLQYLQTVNNYLFFRLVFACLSFQRHNSDASQTKGRKRNTIPIRDDFANRHFCFHSRLHWKIIAKLSKEQQSEKCWLADFNKLGLGIKKMGSSIQKPVGLP